MSPTQGLSGFEKKDREIEELQSLVRSQQIQLRAREEEIRRLERERYRQEEERALELRNLFRRQNMNNPYQDTNSHLSSLSSRFSDPRQLISSVKRWVPILVQSAILFMLVLHFLFLNHSLYQLQDNFVPAVAEERIKPWESKTPEVVSMMNTGDPFILQRHQCLQAVRDRHLEIFGRFAKKEEKSTVLLVDPAYHSNVGDHMLTIGELEFIKKSLSVPDPVQCHYIQANYFYPDCTSVIEEHSSDSGKKLALWHAGGNWGDLWRDAQNFRISSFRTILENEFQVISMPQSLFYENEYLKENDVFDIKANIALGLGLAVEEEEPLDLEDHEDGFVEQNTEFDDIDFNHKPPWLKSVNTSRLDTVEGQKLAHSRVFFTWREKESYEEALKLYPFVTNLLVPDIAFQLGPYGPIRRHPAKNVDILLFLRADKESTVESERYDSFIQSIIPKQNLTFRIVDWSDRRDIFAAKDTFFTETSIELLSLGKVVVCDRLHAAILSYLIGLPFVYIDQVSGKITKTLNGAFGDMEECRDGENARWAKASNLEEALVTAAEFIDRYKLDHRTGSIGVFGGLRNFFS